MGGLDVFFTNMTDRGWGEPVNAGFPLNDTGDNGGITALDGGKTVYLSRPGIKTGNSEDIFRLAVGSNLPLPPGPGNPER